MRPLPTTEQALRNARERFQDALLAAEVPAELHIGLIAACEAVAKARAIAEIAALTAHRADGPVEHVS